MTKRIFILLLIALICVLAGCEEEEQKAAPMHMKTEVAQQFDEQQTLHMEKIFNAYDEAYTAAKEKGDPLLLADAYPIWAERKELLKEIDHSDSQELATFKWLFRYMGEALEVANEARQTLDKKAASTPGEAVIRALETLEPKEDFSEVSNAEDPLSAFWRITQDIYSNVLPSFARY